MLTVSFRYIGRKRRYSEAPAEQHQYRRWGSPLPPSLPLSVSLSDVCLLYCNMKLSFQGAKAISDMLKKNKTIRFVQLSNNTIEYSVCINVYWNKKFTWISKGERAYHMIAYLMNYESILFLVLQQGFDSIADALLENNTLRSLYLKLVAHKPSAFTL